MSNIERIAVIGSAGQTEIVALLTDGRKVTIGHQMTQVLIAAAVQTGDWVEDAVGHLISFMDENAQKC